MTGPHNREAHVPTCLCGHNQRRHEVPGFDGECIAEGCGCRTYTARQAGAPVRPVSLGQSTRSTPSGTTVAQLVAAGKASGYKRTVAMAERVETYARDLATRLRAERDLANAVTRASADRAVLATPMPPVTPLPDDEGARKMRAQPTVCEDCGETFPSGHAKGAHRRHKHPKAAAS